MTEERVIAVLEDTQGRITRMLEVVSVPVRVFRRSAEMIAWLRAHAEQVTLISLDYHLACRADGTGLDVAHALAQDPPRCPVIVHSSDTTGAAAAVEVLVDAGWTAEAIPFESQSWARAVERLLG